MARIDSLESLLHDKESELEKAKQKLLAHPDVQKEEELQLQIDEANRFAFHKNFKKMPR